MAYRGYRAPTSGPLWILIGVNILIFIVAAFYQDLVFRLGLQPATWLDRPWTIVTALFVHRDLWHILGNMFTLYFLGEFLISLVGERKFLIVYFLGGLAGNLVYIALGAPFSIAIGASGAIFAVGGALTAMRPTVRVYVFPIPSPIPLWIAIIGGFVIISFLPNVAWQAHLGGLALGLLAGYILRKQERHRYY